MSSQLFGSLDFNGTLLVEDPEDNDWVNSDIALCLPSYTALLLDRCRVGNADHQQILYTDLKQAIQY